MRSSRTRIVVLLLALAPGAVQAQPGQAAADGMAWEVPAVGPLEPIAPAEYAARRRALMEQVGDGVLLALGAPAPAADYLPFEQDSRYRWLTGVTEPSTALILIRENGRLTERLFVRTREPSREIWEGSRMGVEGARTRTGIPAEPLDRLVPVVDSLVATHGTLTVLAEPPEEVDPAANLSYEMQFLVRLRDRHPKVTFTSAAREVTRLRATKSAAELDRIRRASWVTALAHREAMRAAAAGMNEFEIQALVEYMFRRNGGDGPAYASIVGSGPNSTILHYNASQRFGREGEVLLMDVATSYDGYAADVTRTVPLNGTFSPEQRAIYEVVLAAQKAAERALVAGATWRELNDAANRAIANGLARLGLIDSPDATYQCGPSENSQCPQTRLFYMHGLGHGVGLDVHDPDISTFDAFQPGSAVTIEPGVYVRAEAFDNIPDTPENRAMAERLRAAVEKYRDIGVRIEDVFVTDENGVERVSRGAPREIDEIEALMREPSFTDPSRRPDIVDWRRNPCEPGAVSSERCRTAALVSAASRRDPR